MDSPALVDPTTSSTLREAEIAGIHKTLGEAMREIRGICNGLVLPQIEKDSIAEIVKRVVEAHRQKTGTVVDTTIDEDVSELAPALKICIYRFVQEALNNAYRHGGGIQQAVRATSHGGGVRIEVSDRGEGFDPAVVAPASLGLAGLRERIDSLGGEFDIKTGEGGTTVTMTFAPMEVEE